MWEDIVKSSERYKGFTILNKPMEFNELFKGHSIPCVQLHSTQVYGIGSEQDIVGFCGSFKWENGEVIPFDGDTYNMKTTVLGYYWFDSEDGKCIDILVGDDW